MARGRCGQRSRARTGATGAQRDGSSALGLATAPAGELLALQMRFAREAQQRLHAKWRQHGCDACEPPPDLAAVRRRLDALGAEQLRAIHLAAPALAAPDFITRYSALAESGSTSR